MSVLGLCTSHMPAQSRKRNAKPHFIFHGLQTARGESGEGSRSVVRGDRVRMGYGVSGAGRSASRLASTFFREADRLCSIVRIGTGDDARSRRWKLGRSPPRPAPVNAGCDCHRRRRGFRAALHATMRPMSRDIKNPQARHLGLHKGALAHRPDLATRKQPRYGQIGSEGSMYHGIMFARGSTLAAAAESLRTQAVAFQPSALLWLTDGVNAQCLANAMAS